MNKKSQKKKEREKKSHTKVLRNRERLRTETKKQRDQDRLQRRTRRPNQPLSRIFNQKVEQMVEVDPEVLKRNLEMLKTMEQEFIDSDNAKREFWEGQNDQ